MNIRLALCIMSLCSFMACTTEAYDSGDSTYSYMRADFAEAYTDNKAQFYAADTDDNRHIVFLQTATREWATTPDSTYRTLVYYSDKQEVDAKHRVFSVLSVPVLKYKMAVEVKEMHTDPLSWNSAWVSSNGKYLNMGLTIMTGLNAEGEVVLQNLALVCDEIITHDDGKREFAMRLYHAQNESPQYYSSDVYASIPLEAYHPGDVIRVTVNTYDGEVTREYSVTP